MHFLSWIITLPVAAVVIAFAVYNREEVPVDLWPLPYVEQVPLFAMVLAPFLIGFVFGGFIFWLSGGPARAKKRARLRTLQTKERELDQSKAQVKRLEAQLKKSEDKLAAASSKGAIAPPKANAA